MNYGHYFKLNQKISKVVDGVTVYDYIDLPAFFGPSRETPQTPKYPINVTITADSVLFHLHYSSYKFDSERNDSNEPIYRLHLRNMLDVNPDNMNDANLTTVHMEEVIMELPYVDTHMLSDKIKEVYDTFFPMPKKYGGRYFHQLLDLRYGEGESKLPVAKEMYKAIRDAANETISYSRLQEFGVSHEKDIYVEDDKVKEVKRFLRKLLLDFMFDLRHSDIFQLNPHYRQMLTGLMSDFYFSALLHKCEYYYQRKLVSLAKKNRIGLYCKDFFQAENQWIHDIMDSLSEREFYTAGAECWFLPPEEEMRKLLFKAENEIERNVDDLIKELELRRFNNKHSNKKKNKVRETEANENEVKEMIANGDEIIEMVATHDRNREASSRWFLQRYDFADVLRLHFFPNIHWLFFIAVLIVCVLFTIPSIPVAYPTAIGTILFATLVVTAIVRLIIRKDGVNHFIACLHLFMPRLVAAITTAWLTLALCYELIIAVFYREPAWVVMGIILIVLAVFVLYKINNSIPRVKYLIKICRTVQFLILSYFISAVIGLIVIACVGEPFIIEATNGICDGESFMQMQQQINNSTAYLIEDNKLIFVLRKLTITFSFIAMFIGIFIQLIIGEEKQMTEL